jgi:PAT family beta-lactamase induction signal transducer AmpG
VRLGETTGSRLLLFGGLYFAQGVPWGFVGTAMTLRLTGLGVGPGTLGWMLGLAYAPYVAKPLVAPLVDLAARWRRPLILVVELAMAATLVVLSGLSPLTTPALFAVAIVAHNACAALQDVATDAMALALLPPAERGRANGVMSAAKYAGVLVGGAGLALVSTAAGWRTACLCAVVLLLLPAVLVLFAVEGERTTARPAVLRETVRAFASRAAVLGALFVLLAGVSDPLLTPLLTPLLRRQLAIPEASVARLLGLIGLTGAAGGLLGGWLSDRVGRRRTLAIAAVGLAATHLSFAAAAPLWSHRPVVVGYLLAFGITTGMLFAGTLALCMDLTRRQVAATHFQIYMALMNLRLSGASYVGGRLADRLPVPAMLVLGAAVELAPLLLLPFVAARRESAGPSR